MNLETALPQIMSAPMAVEMDRVCLLGSGSAPEPRGIANTSRIGTRAHDAALANYALMLTARTDILSQNAGPVSASITHPRDEGTVSNFTDTTNQPLKPPRVLTEIPMLTATSIPTDGGTGTDENTIFVGNFASLMIRMRQDISILVSRDFALDKL
ncbi:Phage capsid family protein [Roseovarius litoreus]|uniref:Phage capsid family protein n=1 Tax=Roseovarius litoreus TaxID=1155722 RepID=A0A1M7CUM7_9RHOB|nr:Phage capsid family protein [Roseovarius litoreus]